MDTESAVLQSDVGHVERVVSIRIAADETAESVVPRTDSTVTTAHDLYVVFQQACLRVDQRCTRPFSAPTLDENIQNIAFRRDPRMSGSRLRTVRRAVRRPNGQNRYRNCDDESRSHNSGDRHATDAA
jgi:hypothetical protein